MASVQITISSGTFVAPLCGKTTKLGKAGITGGIEVDLTAIPENVLTKLLFDAITSHIQAEVKKVDAATANQENVRAAAEGALTTLKAGVGGKKDGTATKVRAKAKTMLKQVLRSRFPKDQMPDAKKFDAMVSNFFKNHTAWVKSKDPALAEDAKIVQTFLTRAREAIEADERLTAETMAALSNKAQPSANEAPPTAKATAKPKAPTAPKPKTR